MNGAVGEAQVLEVGGGQVAEEGGAQVHQPVVGAEFEALKTLQVGEAVRERLVAVQVVSENAMTALSELKFISKRTLMRCRCQETERFD